MHWENYTDLSKHCADILNWAKCFQQSIYSPRKALSGQPKLFVNSAKSFSAETKWKVFLEMSKWTILNWNILDLFFPGMIHKALKGHSQNGEGGGAVPVFYSLYWIGLVHSRDLNWSFLSLGGRKGLLEYPAASLSLALVAVVPLCLNN